MVGAKLELRTLLEAMAPEVDRIITGSPTPLRNNTLQGYAPLPARFVGPRSQPSGRGTDAA